MNTYGVTEQSKSYSAGTQNEMPMTLGISFLLLFAAWFIGGTTRKTNKSSNRMEMWLCVFLGMVSLLFVTYLLPYTALANLIPFLEFPERSLQYPWRFLSEMCIRDRFCIYRFFASWIYGFSAVGFYILLTPLIQLWLGDKWMLPGTVTAAILIDYYFKGERVVLSNFKTAAGVFEQDVYKRQEWNMHKINNKKKRR